MQAKHLTETRFSDFALSPALLKGLEDLGLEYCTPIQAKSLPLSLKGKDIAGQAQTGTGKTAAFLLATFQSLLEFSDGPPPDADPIPPRAIIIAPTRELAIQIHKDACAIGKHTGLKYGLVYGGTGYESQRQALSAGVDIVIGTPGRLIDYFKQRVYSLRHMEVVVLDEADRMFDLGFITDIRYLLRRMPDPGQRLNMLFSATLPRRVHELAYEHMNSPAEIEIEPEQVTAERVVETLYHVAVEEKIALLLGLLKQANDSRALVFTNTKRAAERVTAYLMGNGHDVALLSGDIPQKKRQYLLERFKTGQVPTLVATDVAARGLHIPEVAYVINFDLPQDAEDYVHRIGRTARAGAAGIALSLACDEYVYSLPEIEAFIGHKITVAPISEELLTEPKPPARRERLGERISRPGDRHARGKGGRSGSRKPKSGSDRSRARSDGEGKAAPERKPSDGAQMSTDAATSTASTPSKRRRVRRRRRTSGAEATEPT